MWTFDWGVFLGRNRLYVLAIRNYLAIYTGRFDELDVSTAV